MKWYYGLYPTDRININGNYYYISSFFPNINILFSIWPLIYNNNYFYKIIRSSSFRRLFSISTGTKIIADSGAFSYYRSKIRHKISWKLDDILKLYDIVKPDFGVHNDIPISFFKNNEKIKNENLLKKNLMNAVKFLKISKYRSFEPIGVAHGIEEVDYLKQILELYSTGYDYIGIGGIAYLGIKKIKSILSYIFQELRIDKLKIKLHLFGIGRLEILSKYKIYSFDNTTPLSDSHRDKTGKFTYYYTIENSGKVLKKNSLYNLKKSKLKVECECPVCRIIGDEILKTGSTNRNHSRAFHNAYIYQKCLKLIK